jgi:hypothetical protein
VASLMRRMGIEALYRKPNTSERHPQRVIDRYWLRAWRSSAQTTCGRWTSPFFQSVKDAVHGFVARK